MSENKKGKESAAQRTAAAATSSVPPKINRHSKKNQHHCPGNSGTVDGFPGNCSWTSYPIHHCETHQNYCLQHGWNFMKARQGAECVKCAKARWLRPLKEKHNANTNTPNNSPSTPSASSSADKENASQATDTPLAKSNSGNSATQKQKWLQKKMAQTAKKTNKKPPGKKGAGVAAGGKGRVSLGTSEDGE